jgi:hypothetical protein
MSGPNFVSQFARDSVRRRTAASMTAIIEILRGSLSTLDPATGLVGGMTDVSRVYRGPARIRSVTNGGTVDLGGGQIATRDTIVSIPMTSPKMPHRDDLIRVLNDLPADADLNTRIFRVLDADGGGLFGDARRMGCSGWLQSRYWGTQ